MNAILRCLPAAACLLTCWSLPAPGDPLDRDALRRGLETIGLSESDARLAIDPGMTDAFRFPMIDSLLAAPLEVPARCEALAGWTDAVATAAVRALDGTLALQPRSERLHGEDPRIDVSETFILGQTLQDAGAPPAQVRFVSALFEAAVMAAGMAAPADTALLREAIDYLQQDEDEEDLDPFESRARERQSIRESDEFFQRAETVDISRMLRTHRPPVAAIEVALDMLPDVLEEVERGEWVSLRWPSQFGDVVLASTGDDRHDAPAFLLVDPAGNDHYPRGAGGTGVREVGARIAVDLAGDDVYRADGPGTLAAGIGGCGILVDVSGNDTYQARTAGLGAGIMGVGVLLDLSGHDIYQAESFGQGAGFLGLGLLMDVDGSDVYRMAAYGQGYGFVGGVGILRDQAGGDRYLSAPLYTDVLRYEDHHVSFLQGAAFGSRPDRSGGVGLLIDDAGNDHYGSDIFGQGVAYWFGLGGLLDRGGHDVYAGYQYSQGAGVHLAVAALVDDAGQDLYHARGVSQGCGHDLAAGFLIDREGNDNYVSVDLSQGAGSANGLGVLHDLSGEDAYVIRKRSNSMGYGNPRRGTGSIGLFLDARGQDGYTRRGMEDGTLWWKPLYGAGLDDPTAIPEDEVWPEDPAVELPDRSFDDHELFVLASTGPPRYRLWREHAIEALGERGADAAPTLLRYMNTRIPRERHGLKDVFKSMGPTSVRFLASVLDTGEVRSVREAAWCLGFVGSPSAIAPLESLLGRDDAALRTTAAMALGRIARSDSSAAMQIDAGRLFPLVEDADPSARRAAVFALGSLGKTELIPTLVASLDDAYYQVRITAVDGLLRIGPDAGAALSHRLQEGGMGRTWACTALARLPGSAAGPVLAAVGDPGTWPVDERIALSRAVGRHPDAAGLAELRGRLVGDPDWRVRAALDAGEE